MNESTLCYHCKNEINKKTVHYASFNGENHALCCAGCLAVATLIHDGGFDRYYERRDQRPDKAYQTEVNFSPDTWLIYDDPAVQASFVRNIGNNEREAVMSIEGLRCAACVWLNEHYLLRQPGVVSVHLNLSNHRLRIRWKPEELSLSQIFKCVSDIGYRAWPFDSQTADNLMVKEQRSALFRLAVALMGMMQVMMYAWPAYFAPESVSPEFTTLLNWVSLFLTLPVIFYSAAPLYRSALKGIVNRHIGMDVPVVLGISTAFIASTIATIQHKGAVYFDSVSMFVGLLLAARYLELRIRQKARSSAEQIVHHMPAVCQRLSQFPDGTTESIATVHLSVGDVVYIKPGEVFPGDGEVVSGESEAEEALLTGESRPIPKRMGDTILAGSYNFSSPLVVRITHTGETTRLAEIANLLDKALTQKPRIAEIADRIASWFIVALLVIATVTGSIWYWLDPKQAIMIMVSVLVVSCPCALSLATPAALAAATGALARKSVLVLGGQALETLSQVTDVVMDKTGTLTTGKFELIETRGLTTLSPKTCLQIAAGLAKGSIHPLAECLNKEENPVTFDSLKSISGMGMEGTLDGTLWRMGRYDFVNELNNTNLVNTVDIPPHLSTVWLGNQHSIQAVMLFSDRLREGTLAFIAAMKTQGKVMHLLSGDRTEAVDYWAKPLGIQSTRAQATPLEKQHYVQQLQANNAIVAMIGDGVNDAPVLGIAQVSLTLGGAAPLAQAGADIVLMNDNLESFALAFDMATRTRRIIIQNLFWAFAYNVIAIPLAATGLITPLWAGVGMSCSSLVVVLNALRLAKL